MSAAEQLAPGESTTRLDSEGERRTSGCCAACGTVVGEADAGAYYFPYIVRALPPAQRLPSGLFHLACAPTNDARYVREAFGG